MILFFFSKKFRKFENSRYFLENYHFFEISGNLGPHRTYVFHYLIELLSYPYWSSIYAWQRLLGTFHHVIEKNLDNSTNFRIGLSFCAGPSLPGLATVSVWQSCGKPSTKFPHGGLVECLFILSWFCFSFQKNLENSKILDIFLKIIIFSKFLEIWDLIEPMFSITLSSFYHIHIDLQYTLDNDS